MIHWKPTRFFESSILGSQSLPDSMLGWYLKSGIVWYGCVWKRCIPWLWATLRGKIMINHDWPLDLGVTYCQINPCRVSSNGTLQGTSLGCTTLKLKLERVMPTTWSIWGADTVSMWVFGIINSPVVRTVFSRWIVVKVNLGGFQLVSNLFANGGLSTEQSHTVNSLDTICSCACFIDNHWGAK